MKTRCGSRFINRFRTIAKIPALYGGGGAGTAPAGSELRGGARDAARACRSRRRTTPEKKKLGEAPAVARY
jgi:hypothetical protein